MSTDYTCSENSDANMEFSTSRLQIAIHQVLAQKQERWFLRHQPSNPYNMDTSDHNKLSDKKSAQLGDFQKQ